MNNLFVLDAMGYLYRSYFAISNMTNTRGQSTNAIYGFIRSIQKLIKDFAPEHLVVVFDGANSIQGRLAIYPEYKQHRKETPPDLVAQIGWAYEFCEAAGIPILSIPDVEADDTMGSIAVWTEKMGAVTTYLCTSDKDLCQFVTERTFILNTHKDNLILDTAKVEASFGVPPRQIVDYLAITGDQSDNVPGLPGFGPKAACTLLQQFGSLEAILAHPEQVSGAKKQETLRTHGHMAKLSKELVTINIHVKIPHETSFYRLRAPQRPLLEELYTRFSFNSLLRDLEQNDSSGSPKAQEAPISYTLVDDEDSLNALINTLEKAGAVCFDTETTDIRPLQAKLVGIGFCVEPGKAWYVPTNGSLGLERVLAAITPLFANPQVGFYGHNVKYDVHVLSNYGIKIAHLAFDTILASYLLNSHSHRHSLDYLSLQYFGKTKIDIKALIGSGKKEITMDQVPISDVCTYCCEDVDYTCRLKHLLEAQINERGLATLLYELELPLSGILTTMERSGIYVDSHCLEQFSKELAIRIGQLARDIHTSAGEEFNINSPKQLSEILFTKLAIRAPKKTATGYATDAEVLENLRADYPIAGQVLAYRSLEKLRSTYVDALPAAINPNTGRVHCTYNQYVAATGRLSCQDPNLQNIPVRSEDGRRIREAFRPQESGWSFLSADYSQIELRLLAHLSEDPRLIQAFQNEEDIHTYTASLVLNVPIGEVTSAQRQHAKAVNFGIVYGQQAFGLSKELGISVAEASAFIATYFDRYPRVRDFIESCKEQARATGKSVTLTGRERLIPEITNKNPQIRAAAERLAVNTPLQGSSADLIKLAMLRSDHFLNEEKFRAFLVLQIHDELVFEVPDQEIDRLSPHVRKAMEAVWQLRVPLTTSISVGKNWKEC